MAWSECAGLRCSKLESLDIAQLALLVERTGKKSATLTDLREAAEFFGAPLEEAALCSQAPRWDHRESGQL